MEERAIEVVQTISGPLELEQFAGRLTAWLVADMDEGDDEASFTPSRAKALLREAGVVDDPTLNDLSRLLGGEAAVRVALYDLLRETGLAADEEVRHLAARPPATGFSDAASWLELAVAAYAWQRQYPLHQLDPAAPPAPHTPAGQIVARAGHFVRRQVQRSRTDRDRLAGRLAPRPGRRAQRLEEIEAGDVTPPLPPHFRPPVPVRYPEVARETVQVDPDEVEEPGQRPENRRPEGQRPITRGEPLVITEEDLPDADDDHGAAGEDEVPERRPPITISREQVTPRDPPSPLPPSGVVMPAPTRGAPAESRPGLTVALRNVFRSEELKSTKLRVVVQEHPDGPGLYGLQVRVTCKGIKSHVAGTTNREGHFVAELPVRLEEGLTYDVDVTWPRDLGDDVERKSITLNADRTEFRLPFYRRHNPDE